MDQICRESYELQDQTVHPHHLNPTLVSAVGCHSTTAKMSNQNPMQDYINRMQQMARTRGGGGFPGGGPNPRGFIGLVGTLALLGGGAVLFRNALFNVDGGHRAIKYRRLSGVSKEIYSEGMFYLLAAMYDSVSSRRMLTITARNRHPLCRSLVRDARHIRCSSTSP